MMYSSSARTIWITIFSIFTMLSSTFAFSSPSMAFQMSGVESSKYSNSSPCDMPMLDGTEHVMDKSVSSHNGKADCEMPSDDLLTCGTNFCNANTAILLSCFDDFSLINNNQFILFHLVDDISFHASSLYRPPIA